MALSLAGRNVREWHLRAEAMSMGATRFGESAALHEP